MNGTQTDTFFAYAEDFRGGVRVSTAKLSDQPGAVLLTAAGPGGGPQINLYQRPASAPLMNLIGMRPEQRTGYRVAGSAQRIVTPSTSDFVVQDAYDQIAAAIQAEQQAREAARVAAEQAQLQLIQQYYIYAPQFFQTNRGFNNGFGGLGFGGLGGFGSYGFGPTVIGSNYGSFYDPYFYDPYLSYGAYDPFYNFGYYDPGFYDYGYYDPGFYDYGYYGGDFYDGGFYDGGYYY